MHNRHDRLAFYFAVRGWRRVNALHLRIQTDIHTILYCFAMSKELSNLIMDDDDNVRWEEDIDDNRNPSFILPFLLNILLLLLLL